MTEEPKCYIQIVFNDVGSVEFVPNISANVSPFQLFAISEYLRLIGEATFMRIMIQQEEVAKRNRIAIPGQSLEEMMK